MNYYSRVYIYIIYIFLITSCTNNYKFNEQQLSSLYNNKKGLVIIDGPYAQNKTHFLIAQTYWSQSEDTGIEISTLDVNKESNVFFYFLAPGTYDLNEIKYSDGYAGKLKNIAQFNVKAGEVVYLGRLIFDYSKSRNIAQSIRVTDDINKAESFIKKYHPELNIKLQKRLIEPSVIVKMVQK